MVEVKYHTKLKHRLLGGYLSVCARYVKSNRKRCFVVVDLFAGDGKSECSEVNEEWEGSSQIISKWVSRCGENSYCILNERNKDLIPVLKENTKKYCEYIKEIYNKDANIIYKEILNKHIPLDSHSIFLLDPYNHGELSFSTIEGIAKHSEPGVYYGREGKEKINFIRRPELIINFPLYTILVSMTQNQDLITAYLGTDEWIEAIEKAKRESKSQEGVLLDIFKKQLAKYYGDKGIVSIRIQTLKTNSPVYYLIFTSTHPLANKIHNNFSKWIDSKRNEFKKDGFRLLKIEEAKRNKIKTFDNFKEFNLNS